MLTQIHTRVSTFFWSKCKFIYYFERCQDSNRVHSDPEPDDIPMCHRDSIVFFCFLDWRLCFPCILQLRSCLTGPRPFPDWVTSSKRFAAEAVPEISLFPTQRKRWKCSRIKIISMQREKRRWKPGPRVWWSIWMKVKAQWVSIFSPYILWRMFNGVEILSLKLCH